MYEFVQRLYPIKLKKGYQQLLTYCNITMDVNRFLTINTIATFIGCIVLTLFTLIFFDINFFLLMIAWFVLLQGIVYAWLALTADSRASFVEELLPDALQLMASNLRAGLTIDRALLLSARPEFGHFKDELNYVGKQLATGKELGDALMELSSRIRSERLKKTFQIIVSAMASGGELAELLVQTATNLRQQRLVEQRVRSSVLAYVIFIFSAIAFGAPILFGLSSFLVEVITDIFSKVQLPPEQATANLPLSFTNVSIKPSFINAYTMVAMIFTSIMGSLILGLIAKGKEKEGLKFLPLLLIITISLYYLVKISIRALLGGLFQF